VIGGKNGSVRLYCVQSDQTITRSLGYDHIADITCMCVATVDDLITKTFVISASVDGTVRMWSPHRPTLVKYLCTPTHIRVKCMAVHGNMFVNFYFVF
jgi:WD40 repeat protein